MIETDLNLMLDSVSALDQIFLQVIAEGGAA
jgi:hypothetical protein